MNRKKAALMAFKKKKKWLSRHLSGEVAKLTAFNSKNSEVNGVEPEKAALTVLSWKSSGINGVEPEKNGVNSVELEKSRN